MLDEFRMVVVVADTGIDDDFSVSLLDIEISQGGGDEIVLIAVGEFIPDGFGNDAEHDAAVGADRAGINQVYFWQGETPPS